MKLPESLNRARASAYAEGAQNYTPGPYRRGMRPGAEIAPYAPAPRAPTRAEQDRDSAVRRMLPAQREFTGVSPLQQMGNEAFELTGLPSMRRAGRAAAQGDLGTAALEGGMGALGVAGLAALRPSRGLFGSRAAQPPTPDFDTSVEWLRGSRNAASTGAPLYARNARHVGLDTYIVDSPADLRSRFAAFDPSRSGESDLLAAPQRNIPPPGSRGAPPPQPPQGGFFNARVPEMQRRGSRYPDRVAPNLPADEGVLAPRRIGTAAEIRAAEREADMAFGRLRMARQMEQMDGNNGRHAAQVAQFQQEFDALQARINELSGPRQ